MEKKTILRIAVAAFVVLLVASFVAFDLGRFLSLEYIKSQQAAFAQYYAENMAITIAVFLVIYVLSTALSLPGAAVLSLLGGALFGFWIGLVVVSFASSIGASCAFLVSRFLLRDVVQKKFGDKVGPIMRGVEREGAFYLFSMRLIPAFPFFAINLVMGLTPINTLTFYWVSQVGMLPGTIVYVNAGTQLGQIEKLSDIASPTLLISFALLGLFPLLVKWTMKLWTRGKVTQS